MQPNENNKNQEPSYPSAHPPTTPAEQPVSPQTEQPAQPPQIVYVQRPVNPGKAPISEEAMAKYQESKVKHPSLNLSEGEYVISAVRRHPIGLVPIFGFVGFTLLLLGAAIPIYNNISSTSSLPPVWAVGLVLLLLALLVVIGGYIAVFVYMNNKFFLTNESVIQEIQTSLFDKHEQTVSLINIEDASFQQRGILQMLLNYGSIRLSTEGDETTYRFNYVANPKKEIALLNNAVEAFKNGRPVVND